MKSRGTFLAVTGCLALSGAIAVADAPNDPSRGAELLMPFKSQLKQALLDGMAEGPATAIDVCRVQAPAIAADLAVDGIRLGRTSHRLRNPSNTAPEWVSPVLDSWLAEDTDRAPVSMRIGSGREGYVEPILLQPLCATCHGTEIPADIAAEIADAYPDDEATGFEVGDLRGVFWIEYDVDDSVSGS